MTNLKIKQINITLFRVISSFIVLLPIAISYSAQWSIALSFMVFPLLSLILAAIAKYIDFHIVGAMLLAAQQELVSSIEGTIDNKTSRYSINDNSEKLSGIQIKDNQKAA
ncbi:hypothetical protein [Thalassotalea crassostreae]|uniref:hypothetical protein n=1 Tax=Thalassotalea crassostreae TaxID=1763536 RepID=UPI000838C328|nr:hypothetical protein [Thalassotalea crassostreae]